MEHLTGLGTLLRFAVRRDRVRIAVWTAVLILLVGSSAAGVEGIYPTAEDLREAAAAVEDNPAAIAFNGPARGLETLGGRVAFETAAFGYVVIALMGVFMVGRSTRAEEESGRVELLRATALGRHVPLTAALLVVVSMAVLVGVGVTAALLSLDLPSEGSVLLGVCFVAVGVAFAAVTSVAAQVTENARVAYGLAGAFVGLSFVLRAAGDVGDGTLSWLSPMGWALETRPFAGDRWWPLLLLAAFSLAMLAGAVALAAHRDVGGGLVPPRPGPARGAPSLAHPLGLPIRLQRASVLWWCFGVAVLGVVYGSVAQDLEDFIGDNEALREILAAGGGASLVDAFLDTTLLLMGVVAGGFAVQSALRPRSEEAAVRAEPLLATPLARLRWLGGWLAVSLAGSAAVVAAGGLGLGATYALVSGEPDEVLRLVGAALARLPAVWVLVGLVTALVGLVPRAAGAAWLLLAWCLVVTFFGELLQLPDPARAVSPFEHGPALQGGDLTVLPIAVLLAVAAALVAAGAAGFTRRDVG